MTTVFFDIDTQIDFVFPAGALYVPGAERLLPAFRDLNRYAAEQRHPLVSTTDAHLESDPEFLQWPPHCVLGTAGQQKPAVTLLDRQSIVPNEAVDLSAGTAPQIIVRKQQLDLFTNPNVPALLDRLGAGEYVVYGVVTEYCVRCAAMGLLRTGKPVRLVTDAIQTLDPARSEAVLREFTSAGGKLTTVSAVLRR